MAELCEHGRKICSDCIVVDDAARRAFDVVMLKATFTDYDTRVRQSPYMAIRLADGSSDGVLYDTKADAVRHQLHETQCAYFSFRFSPMGFARVKDAAIFLSWNRAAYDAGHLLPDPEQTLRMPTTNEVLFDQYGRLAGVGRG